MPSIATIYNCHYCYDFCIIAIQVACGEKFTLVLTQDGTNVFGFGVRGSGQFGRDNWTPKEVFVPVVSSCIVVT